MNYTEFSNRLEKNKPIDLGDILNKSFELFKRTWTQGLIHLLLNFLIVIPISLLVFIPMFFAGLIDTRLYEHSEPSILTIITMFVMVFPAVFLASTFTMLLNAAFFRIVKRIDYNEDEQSASFGMFFTGGYIKKSFVLAFVTSVIALVATLACFLPLLYIAVPLNLIPVIFAFNPELSWRDLVKASFTLGTKKWLIIFGLMIVSAILAEIVGFLLCGIGIFVTMSFVYLPMYFVYKEVIGFDSNDVIGEKFTTNYSN